MTSSKPLTMSDSGAVYYETATYVGAAGGGGGHAHDWRLVFRGSDGLWYCTGCRITEPFEETTDDE